MRLQGMSLGFSADTELGRPALIFASSLAETIECSSGELRAIKYHINPASNPRTAQTRNEARQPWRNMMYVTKGGVNPAPTPTPEKIRPFANPRSALGIQ